MFYFRSEAAIGFLVVSVVFIFGILLHEANAVVISVDCSVKEELSDSNASLVIVNNLDKDNVILTERLNSSIYEHIKNTIPLKIVTENRQPMYKVVVSITPIRKDEIKNRYVMIRVDTLKGYELINQVVGISIIDRIEIKELIEVLFKGYGKEKHGLLEKKDDKFIFYEDKRYYRDTLERLTKVF